MPTAIVLLDAVSLGHPFVPIFLFYGSPVLLLLFVIWLLRVAAERFRRMQKENDSRRVGEVIAKAHEEVRREAEGRANREKKGR